MRASLGAIAAACLAMASACSDGSERVASDAQRLYQANCAACHGANGSGTLGPAIGSGAFEGRLAVDEAVELIANGKGEMPGFGEELSTAEIAAVVAFVFNDLAGG